MPQPLPANPFNTNTHPDEHTAYRTCLHREAAAIAAAVIHPVQSGVSPLICARLLGYMIIHAPTDLGRRNISSEITSCRNKEEFFDLAKLYIQHFLRCCKYLLLDSSNSWWTCSSSFKSTVKAAKGRTPIPSNHPSRPSFDNVSDTFIHMLLEAPQDHQSAKALVSSTHLIM